MQWSHELRDNEIKLYFGETHSKNVRIKLQIDTLYHKYNCAAIGVFKNMFVQNLTLKVWVIKKLLLASRNPSIFYLLKIILFYKQISD